MWCIKCNCNHFIGTCPKDYEPHRNSFIFDNLPKYDPPLLDFTLTYKLPEKDFDVFSSFNKKTEIYYCVEMYCPGHSSPRDRCLQRGGPGLGLGL